MRHDNIVFVFAQYVQQTRVNGPYVLRVAVVEKGELILIAIVQDIEIGVVFVGELAGVGVEPANKEDSLLHNRTQITHNKICRKNSI